MKRKCLLAAVLLISAFSSASAQTNWSYGDNGSAGAKGYYGTPHDGGSQYGSGGGGPVRLRARLQLRPSGVEPVPLALLEALAYLRS